MRFLTLLFIFSCFSLSGQNINEFFKVIPSDYEISIAPEWARKMYSTNPKISEIVDGYNDYYSERTFVKTTHTQNYKHWIRCVEPLMNEESYIVQPTEEEEKSKFRKLKEIKNNITQKSVDTWTSIGPFETYKNGTLTPISTHANVYSIDQSENDHQLLICGTESGGVFKTTDKGINWSLISKDEIFCNGITSVKIHPNDDNTFYISGNNRLYKSTDGGTSWSENYNLGGSANEIKFDPEDSDHIFLAASNGLYESVNGGTSWSKPYTDQVWDLDFHPTDFDTIYMLKSNPSLKKSEFYRSLNSGSSWSLISSGWYEPEVLTEAAENGGKIGVSSDEPDRVYVSLIGTSKADDNGWIGIYRSDNSGGSWYLPSGQIGGPYSAVNIMPWNAAAYTSGYHQGFYNFDFEISPNDADLMWFGTIRLSESSDGAYSYVSIGAANSTRLADVHADIQSIHLSSNDIWVASDGGINFSDDNLQSHSSRKYGVIASNFWGFGAGWNEDVLVGGKYHNGNTAYFENYGVGETHNVGGVEESTGYVNPLINRNAYFNQYWSGYTVSKLLPETLGGTAQNINPINLIPNEAYTTSYSSGFYHHPLYTNKMIAGKDSIIWNSTDGGLTWGVLNDFGKGRVLEMEYCRSNPDVIYAIFQPNGGYWDWCQVYKTTDGGLNWTALTDIPSNNRWRLEITTNPENENEIWVASISGANGQKIYRSLDGGSTWDNMTTSIFDGDVIRDIAYHGGSNGLVYALTENSFYYYSPTENNWVQYDLGLPTIQNVLRIKLFYRDNKIRIASKGRGFWEALTPTSFDPIAMAMTTTDTIYCSRDTIQFDSHSIVDQLNTSWAWTVTPTPQYISSLTERNPKVVFGVNGTYGIELTVTNDSGSSDTYTNSEMIHIESICDPDTIQGLALSTFSNGDYVQLPNFETNTNSFTISAWIKPAGIQDNYSSIVMNDGDAAGLNFREGNNTLGYHWPGGAWWWDSNLIAPSDEWSYVALVAEPDGVTIYLNGLGVKHVTAINPVDITTMKIGSYKGWNGRNYRGEIDEVCLWNRSLSQSEIRELRHLTKEDVITDPDLLAYYQFNEDASLVLDKKNLFHGNALGNISFINCYAPFGGGISFMQTISSPGIYNFNGLGIELNFPGTGTFPNNEVVVSRINNLPLPTISNSENLGSYFIINNYGNLGFTDPYDLKYDDPYSSPSSSAISTPSSFTLINRSNNSEAPYWDELCEMDSVDAENYVFVGTSGCSNSQLGQFFLLQCIPNAILTTDYYNGDVITIKTADYIEAYNTIFDGAQVLYSAGNEIRLEPNFEVKLGALFESIMAGCQN